MFSSGKFHIIDKVFKESLNGSDQYPILYSFNFRPDTFINDSPYRWNFSKINWKMWADKLISTFKTLTNPSLISISNTILNFSQNLHRCRIYLNMINIF